jgi:hypothetical protein
MLNWCCVLNVTYSDFCLVDNADAKGAVEVWGLHCLLKGKLYDFAISFPKM